MAGTPPRATPWGGVELLERALGYTRGCLTLVRAEHGHAPSPCTGWDLLDLLTHMDDSLARSTRRGRVAPWWCPAPVVQVSHVNV
jgi:hypothetical protein